MPIAGRRSPVEGIALVMSGSVAVEEGSAAPSLRKSGGLTPDTTAATMKRRRPMRAVSDRNMGAPLLDTPKGVQAVSIASQRADAVKGSAPAERARPDPGGAKGR